MVRYSIKTPTEHVNLTHTPVSLTNIAAGGKAVNLFRVNKPGCADLAATLVVYVCVAEEDVLPGFE